MSSAAQQRGAPWVLGRQCLVVSRQSLAKLGFRPREVALVVQQHA
jgi:hypothetical protein